ncbi:MAG TPA: glycoside hydrolase family 92 protein, partial [Paludibacter sp.]|nr:glycoside hydrolase family 92 protein [Paludibacter sp.]
MKKIFLSCLVVFTACHMQAQTVDRLENPADWVNPLMGSQSKYSLSNGNTYPAIALPWGMNFWVAQTGKMGDGWQYTYDADKI